MNFLSIATKVFAYFLLFFASFILANAQHDSSAYDIEAGTKIRVQMDNEINSKAASVNDTFTTMLAEPLVIREVVALPVGTVIEGRITKVKHASAGGKDGSLTISFETIKLPDGAKRRIEGVLVEELKAANSSPKIKVLTIVCTAAFGGIIGAVSKAQNGALIGAGIGAGAGTSIALLQKGKDVSIKADEKFEIRLTKNVTLPPQDY